MSVVVLVLLCVAVLAALGLLAYMLVKDKPLYGVLGLGVLAGPGPLLALTYLSLV
ncbi:hypothetical protein ACIGNX_32940 [Actinosynnema sp. NPDC053489]|uniref:hypothetical protein n=1 Tax=Actinosynnema sp. NPDC053489 TaxID=3363916 RepID=UPI0037C67636